MLPQSTNEDVNTNCHSARIIIEHKVSHITFMTFAAYVPILLAVQPLDLKVWVEVEDDALRGLRCRDDPVTVLVWRVLQRVTGGGDVTRLAGIKDASTLWSCWRVTRVGHRENNEHVFNLNIV